jgi:hypothetical protein
MLFVTCVIEQRLATVAGVGNGSSGVSRKLGEDVKVEVLAVHAGMIPRPWRLQLPRRATAGNGSKGGGPAAPEGAAGSYAWCLKNERLKHQRQYCGGVLAHPRTVRT